MPLPGDATDRSRMDQPADLGALFHRLNNQLGIILANAEILDAQLADDSSRARASQIVTSVVEAISAARYIQERCRN